VTDGASGQTAQFAFYPLHSNAANQSQGDISDDDVQRTFLFAFMVPPSVYEESVHTVPTFEVSWLLQHRYANPSPPPSQITTAFDIGHTVGYNVAFDTTDQWVIVALPFPTYYPGGSSASDSRLRLLLQSNGGVLNRDEDDADPPNAADLQMPWALVGGVLGMYEGDDWPGYLCGEETDNTANPETVALGDGTGLEVGVGECAVLTFKYPSYLTGFHHMFGTPSSGDDDRLVPDDTILELGDASEDDHIVATLVWPVEVGGVAQSPVLRISGKVGGTDFTDTDLAIEDDEGRMGTTWTDSVVHVAVALTSDGVRAACRINGLLATMDSAIANSTPSAPLTWSQIGADLTGSGQRYAEKVVLGGGVALTNDPSIPLGEMDFVVNESVTPDRVVRGRRGSGRLSLVGR